MRNTADVTGGKPIAIILPYISGVSAINPLVAFYDIHGGKREVLFFYQSLGRSHLTKLTTASGVVVASKPEVLSEVEDFYGRLYASHSSRPDPENKEARATLTRHFTEDLPENSVEEIEIVLGQLNNGKAPGDDGYNGAAKG
jgi:hypothetical protein